MLWMESGDSYKQGNSKIPESVFLTDPKCCFRTLLAREEWNSLVRDKAAWRQ